MPMKYGDKMMCSIRSCLFWFVIGACLVAYNKCSAKDVNYSDRGDRFEGVITRKDISGDYFNFGKFRGHFT